MGVFLYVIGIICFWAISLYVFKVLMRNKYFRPTEDGEVVIYLVINILSLMWPVGLVFWFLVVVVCTLAFLGQLMKNIGE